MFIIKFVDDFAIKWHTIQVYCFTYMMLKLGGDEFLENNCFSL